jgi:gamma-butyrobetaine dioxygenase
MVDGVPVESVPVESVPVESVLAPLRAAGGSAYLGEPVTQLDHALQAAALADAAGASASLVVAALLHDVGWLLGGTDDDHAGRGATFLAQWLPPSVSEPVRLHVAAKRWLCAREPGYYDLLSDASKHTLTLQGGPMAAAELARFEAEDRSADAVLLRRWDDGAKLPGRVVPDLDHWRSAIAAVSAGP